MKRRAASHPPHVTLVVGLLASVAACGTSTSDLALSLDALPETTSVAKLQVAGTVTGGSGTVTLDVAVDDKSVASPTAAAGGAFSAEVTLTLGDHTVTVTAKDDLGNTTGVSGAVTYGLACAAEAPTLLRLRSVVAAPTGGTNADLIKEEGATTNAQVFVDARAGGTSVPQSYTYAKFTSAGLVPVAISDVDAATSTAWDIAFRRSGIRVNSGVSGPSSVGVAKADTSAVPAGATYKETLAAKFAAVTGTSGLTFAAEDYFTQGCQVAQDSHGNGGADFLTEAWWDYTNGCLAVTGEVFVLALPDGKNAKVQVLSYYSPAVQDVCNETPASFDPMSPTNGSAQYRITWQYL